MTKEEFIFSKTFPQRSYRHIIFWLIYYLFSLLTYFHPFLERTTFGKWVVVEIVEVFFHVLTQMVFCYIILYLLLPLFFNRKKYFSFLAGLFILSLATYGCYHAEARVFSKVHAYAGLSFLSNGLLHWYLFISFISYFPMSTGLTLSFKLLKDFYVKQKENQTLSRENANAELQLLKAQIHPHFLFNTLNNIYSFTLDRSMQAPRLVMNLSDTLKYIITDCECDTVPLDKELKMINDYIDLEKIRYTGRLNIEVNISGATANKSIVPLLMIPFIENSFKHGASKMLRETWIRLNIQADKKTLHFTLANSKPMEPMAEKLGGIGLNNVKKRLELLYPAAHLLILNTMDNTFTVNMQIPLHEYER